MEVVRRHREKFRLRVALLIGTSLLGLFILADIVLLPTPLHEFYLQNRLLYQLPFILAVIAFSYSRFFYANRSWVFAGLMLVLTFANYLLIYQSWALHGFAFPYEGTILYAFYCVFALGVSYKLALVASLLSIAGFIGLMMVAPVYGDRVMISTAFVVGSLFICAYAKYRLDRIVILLKTTNKKLNTLSREDELTSLLNRRALMKEGERLLSLSKRQKLSFAVIMLDLDDFKKYNDAFGHQQGDEAIVTQADVMRAVFQRQTDILGRYGGEEFMIIVSGVSVQDIEQSCQLILDNWQQRALPHAHDATASMVSCSIGAVVASRADDLKLEELINNADNALYQAKAAGKATYKLSTLN
ncbi:GGDEF domain-containing protein [Alteromonas sp. 1_MG-2023]|uniref:GGDEF domain-containing protein n=1 Tax=Alteromonas sp. 1_MG-2023 TaxID=3062669 RepID=UPI0026E3BFD0|nr:GGDEF domain-containing protein [Alteromonas sp. 1_MG-2023]MDO6566992.1 GGDEF domain-containing protein [Alteromonas sp. 1_MG-2023]